MKKLVVFLMAMVVASGAIAQIDPDPNSLGLYFDVEGTVVSGPAIQYVPTPVYLLLANASQPYISGFECTITHTPGISILASLYGGAVGGSDVLPAAEEYGVGFQGLVATGPVTILAEFSIMLMDPAQKDFYLGNLVDSVPSVPGDYPSIVLSGGEGQDGQLMAAGLSALPGTPCLSFGGEVVANESMSMGAVKALYR